MFIAFMTGNQRHSKAARPLNIAGKIICYLILATLCATFSLSAQSPQAGDIHGQLIDQYSAPITGATVTLTSPALSAPKVATTDKDGKYHFEHLPPGTYKLNFHAEGLQDMIKDSIDITAGLSAEVNLQMGLSAEIHVAMGSFAHI